MPQRRKLASVHPRLRGERSWIRVRRARQPGSSPPARGTARSTTGRRVPSRFIPACAGNGPHISRGRDSPAVHPRLRGERMIDPFQHADGSGSSPPARGTAYPRRGERPECRFIPACAGNGPVRLSMVSTHPVHPRLRGERTVTINADDRIVGSSPPARGTGAHPVRGGGDFRFIPACAGNGDSGAVVRAMTSVHPRLRGERMNIQLTFGAFTGSSPPARGTVAPGADGAGPRRFIPACAGNGCAGARPARSGSVHPRLRGERRSPLTSALWSGGSSPPARGTVFPIVRTDADRRFIPACAGNGGGGNGSFMPQAVHPRLRGERPDGPPANARSRGSSPPARGTGMSRALGWGLDRFIPACAGNGASRGRTDFPPPVHPRLRGERRDPQVDVDVGGGSSPPARGTGHARGRARPRGRFIPACAGNGRMVRRLRGVVPVHPRLRGERLG